LIGFVFSVSSSLFSIFLPRDRSAERLEERMDMAHEEPNYMAIFYWLLVEATSRLGRRVEARVTTFMAQEASPA